MVKRDRRPATATLVKPTLLDTKLLGIFDMSTVSRDHLIAIKNLVHSTPRCACKPVNGQSLSLRCDAGSPPQPDHKIPKMYKVLNRTYRIRTNVRQKLQELSAAAEPADDALRKIPIIPSPCVTCGRPEQPERFHSHPSRVDVKSKQPPSSQPAVEPDKRKTVQKPVAMKFKSNKTKILDATKAKDATPPSLSPSSRSQSKEIKTFKAAVPTPSPKSSPNKENTSKPKTKLCSRWRDAIKKSVQPKRETREAEEEQSKLAAQPLSEGGYKLETWNPAPVSGGRTRKVVCYLCSQEFGTAALPSHEAQCIQKYLKETNDNDNNVTFKRNDVESERRTDDEQENWKLAWEITQASLIPCEFCDRKFLPARVEAHQKICGSKITKESTRNKVQVNVNVPQPGILCENCGKRYGSCSIAIHREQCAKKTKNVDTPPPEQSQSSRKPSSPPLSVVCYICGRNFGTKSIGFHEPQCLKRWKMENDKLSLELQRPLPTKFVESVNQGSDGMNAEDSHELFWKVHEAQLVPCSKCGRTFYPDRLEVHLKGCKGPPKNKAK